MTIISNTRGKVYLFGVEVFSQSFIKIECLQPVH
jgi:hypothetical protein